MEVVKAAKIAACASVITALIAALGSFGNEVFRWWASHSDVSQITNRPPSVGSQRPPQPATNASFRKEPVGQDEGPKTSVEPKPPRKTREGEKTPVDKEPAPGSSRVRITAELPNVTPPEGWKRHSGRPPHVVVLERAIPRLGVNGAVSIGLNAPFRSDVHLRDLIDLREIGHVAIHQSFRCPI